VTRRRIASSCLLALSACHRAPAEPPAVSRSGPIFLDAATSVASTVETSALERHEVVVAAGGPVFRFDLHRDGRAVRAVDVVSLATGAIVQTLTPRDAFGEPCVADRDPDDPSFGFLAVDMSFDGFVDVRLQCGDPDPILIRYKNFLFDPKQGRFTPSAELDALASTELDAMHRMVISVGEITCRGPQEIAHRWEGAQLVPLRCDAQGCDHMPEARDAL
jgi:hypothetical protein